MFTDGLDGEAQAMYFSNARRFLQSIPAAMAMGTYKKSDSSMTNRDRINQMTDEELAVEICNWFERSCESCPAYKSNMCKFGGGYGNGLLKWLKAEAEEES